MKSHATRARANYLRSRHKPALALARLLLVDVETIAAETFRQHVSPAQCQATNDARARAAAIVRILEGRVA